MGVERINLAIHALGYIPSTSEVPRGFVLLVCEASEEEWDAFVASENQELHSTRMQLIHNRIFIVEFPGAARGVVSSAICFAARDDPVVRQYLLPCRESYNRTPGFPRYEPSESFRPSSVWLESIGVRLPQDLSFWHDFVTLKVEVGVTRDWGETEASLDHKARFVWSRFPGVAYVLCIAVDEELKHAEYKLYETQAVGTAPILIATATVIQAPKTIVALDARRLLGIPAGLPLPPLFPDPFLLDLFTVLQEARKYLND